MDRVVLVGLALVAACGRRDFNDGIPDAPPPPQDARPCEPLPECPNSVAYVCNETCYVICYVDKSRPAAAVACADWGGCLATLTDADDNNCAASRLQGEDAWIGATQANSATQPGEMWSWCDGSALDYDAWQNAMPDDTEGVETGQEQCAVTTPAGNWLDRGCNFNLDYVCTRPL